MSKDQKINGPQECDLFTRGWLLFLFRQKSEVACGAGTGAASPPSPGDVVPQDALPRKAATLACSHRTLLPPWINNKINNSFPFPDWKNQVLGAVSFRSIANRFPDLSGSAQQTGCRIYSWAFQFSVQGRTLDIFIIYLFDFGGKKSIRVKRVIIRWGASGRWVIVLSLAWAVWTGLRMSWVVSVRGVEILLENLFLREEMGMQTVDNFNVLGRYSGGWFS